MTTLSQELASLGLQKKIGLSEYISEFEGVLVDRLDSIQEGLAKFAPVVISVCVGGLITSRTFRDKSQSNRFLGDCRRQVLQILFLAEEKSREPHF